MEQLDYPECFTTPVEARHTDTWHLDGHVRTGEQVLGFSEDILYKISELIVQWFQFEYNSVRYEFKLVGDQTERVDIANSLTAMIDPQDLSKCWLNGHMLVVHPWEPEEND